MSSGKRRKHESEAKDGALLVGDLCRPTFIRRWKVARVVGFVLREGRMWAECQYGVSANRYLYRVDQVVNLGPEYAAYA